MSSETVELPNEPEPHQGRRVCTACTHMQVCKGYETVAMALKQIEKYEFLKLPMKAADIAIGCSAYLPVIPTKPQFGK